MEACEIVNHGALRGRAAGPRSRIRALSPLDRRRPDTGMVPIDRPAQDALEVRDGQEHVKAAR